MNLNLKIRLLQIVGHISSIGAIYYVTQTEQYHLLLIAVAVWFAVGPISQVLTLHRLLTHRSFKVSKWMEGLLSLISVISTVGPTMSWVSTHRTHHANSDADGDPHSPNINRKYSMLRGLQVWVGYDWKMNKVTPFLVKDLIRHPIHKFIFDNYFKIIFAYLLLLIAIDPVLVLFAYALPMSCTVFLVGTVNVLGHVHGYRTYETRDCSTNSWVANILSMGDGWHNNHHANPQNYRAGEKWWEWDLMARIINLIRIDLR
jgi:stearoyl-CoA desaturase (delta-9 desaturase)